MGAHAASLAQQVRSSTWQLVSVTITLPNGNKVQPDGPNPSGVQFFDRTGHFITVTSKGDIPKFASNNFRDGTDAEQAAAAKGSLFDFGTYKVDEKTKTLMFHVAGSSFPNWVGINIKNVADIKGDLMTWQNPVGPSQAPVTLVWKRVQ
jgi:hypothetical protein